MFVGMYLKTFNRNNLLVYGHLNLYIYVGNSYNNRHTDKRQKKAASPSETQNSSFVVFCENGWSASPQFLL